MIASETHSASAKPGTSADTNLMGKGLSGRTLCQLAKIDDRHESHLLACGMDDLVIHPAVKLPKPF